MSRTSSRLHRSKSSFASRRTDGNRKRNRVRRRFLTLETMEGRSLLAGLVSDVLKGTASTAVTGTVYEDVNSNGMKDGGENGISNWTVYIDLDNSGTLNNDAVGMQEPSATTNNDGDYVINRLVPGNYRVGEVVKSGWTPTAPVSQDVSVAKDKETKVDFFNFSGGDIVGTVWNDFGGDGVRGVDPFSGEFTEPGLAGWTVFLDLNTNGDLDPSEPSTLTTADGRYQFTNLPPNDYEVTEILPSGWEVSEGFDIKQTAEVVARQTFTQDFANFSISNGSIQGVIWNDTNANGIRETDPDTGEFTEPGLADWTVFLDSNGNRSADPGESTTLTDENGNYAFISLTAGDYEVVEVLPDGWSVSEGFDSKQTVEVVGGSVSVAGDFANFTILNGSIRGTVWNDVNRNGVRDVNVLTGAFTDPGLAGWTILLDLNRNRLVDPMEPIAITDASGGYQFVDLQVGEYEVLEIIPSGWETSTTFSEDYSVIVYSGVESLAPDFANFNLSAASPGTVSGTVWNDLNGNGVRDVDGSSGGFSDPGLSGWTVFVDSNSNRVLDSGEPNATSAADGGYTLSGISPGSISILVQPTTGWRATAPMSGARTIALKSGANASGQDFGEAELKDSTIRGVVFSDTDKDGSRDAGERGLAGIKVYLDLNNNRSLDAGEPEIETSSDLYYTPGVDEAGSYSFTHLSKGTYTVRERFPAMLDATPEVEREHIVTIGAGEDRAGVDSAAVFRANEIHGVKFEDADGNHRRDAGEAGLGNVTIFVDLNRNNTLDASEPSTVTLADGSYSFKDLSPGAYVIREIVSPGYTRTLPTTVGGIYWPSGVSNPAVGNVSPAAITTSLSLGEKFSQTVSLTLPDTGALTNLVDVFLLFDDTGSFVNNSPIVRSAFPDIISQLNTALPGIDLGFGVGRLEEYANFAYEYSTGRPFILNQPVVAASSAGYMTAIQAALNRTTPGYGGDQPETDIEALYQLVTGLGFDGNNNGSVLDSGAAGLASTQLNPGNSGDVPSFASFTADPANFVMPAAGNIGGAGFRAGALPIILLATDTGFAYQPQGESTVTGVGGLSLPVSALTQTSRGTTPFNYGAGFQQTITGLNALGALVIGLGTNSQNNLDPRQGLEALSKLTGATNQSTAVIANGTPDAIAPGDPLYFQIASGFGASVAGGVVSAIQNAVTNVAVDITLQASDPRVQIINHTGIRHGVGAGQTATFDIEFMGEGIPRRFDLQFVRSGTNVILGSIPVVIGTPISGDGFDFEELEEGEIESGVDFGNQHTVAGPVNSAPSFLKGADLTVFEDAGLQTSVAWATAISPGPPTEAGQAVNFLVGNNNSGLFNAQPAVSADGTLTFMPRANAFGSAIVTVRIHDDGGTDAGGIDTSDPQTFTITVTSVNDAPVAAEDAYPTWENTTLSIAAKGVLTNDADLEGDALTAVLVEGPTHGALSWGGDGSFEYTPNTGYIGSDSFTYKASDSSDAASNIVKVTIDVLAVAGIHVSRTGGLLTTEAGGGDTFSVVLNRAPTADVTIPLASLDASEGTTGVSSLVFTTANWNVPQTVTVTGVDDFTVDGDANYMIQLGGAVSGDADYNGLDAPDVAAVNQDNDTPTLTLSISPRSILENGGSALAVVTRNTTTTSDLTVDLSGSDPTEATLPSSVVIPAGQSSVTVTITGVDDAIIDGSQSVSIGASAVGFLGGGDMLTVTDDDSASPLPEVNLVLADYNASESGDTAAFRVTRSTASATPLKVHYSIGGKAINGVDYEWLPGCVVIPAGATEALVIVKPIDDARLEGIESVVLSLRSNSHYVRGAKVAATVALNDDEKPSVGVAVLDKTSSEGVASDPGVFRIRRTSESATPLTIAYTISGTALNGTDYVLLSGSAVIPANKEYVDVIVAPLNDALAEGTETVVIKLSDAATYQVVNREATLSIIDDDKPVLSASAFRFATEKSESPGSIRITRSAVGSSDVTVRFSLSGTAINGVDYKTVPGSIILPAGRMYIDVLIQPLSDALREGRETVRLDIIDNDDYQVKERSATIVINDYQRPTVNVWMLDATAREGSVDTGKFRIARGPNALGDMTVKYSLGGSAENGRDYVLPGGSVTIPAGKSYIDLVLTALVDGAVEGAEAVRLSLLDDSAYELDDRTSHGVVTISDSSATSTPSATDAVFALLADGLSDAANTARKIKTK